MGGVFRKSNYGKVGMGSRREYAERARRIRRTGYPKYARREDRDQSHNNYNHILPSTLHLPHSARTVVIASRHSIIEATYLCFTPLT